MAGFKNWVHLHSSARQNNQSRYQIQVQGGIRMASNSLSGGDLRRLIAKGENDTVEFKRTLPPDEDVARNLSAFANTGGGTLIIGVSDNGQLLGLSPQDAERAQKRIAQIAYNIMPGRVEEVSTGSLDGRLLAYAAVRPPSSDNSPVITATGELFQRRGERTIKSKFGTVKLRSGGGLC